jgi:hypothetical protein
MQALRRYLNLREKDIVLSHYSSGVLRSCGFCGNFPEKAVTKVGPE